MLQDLTNDRQVCHFWQPRVSFPEVAQSCFLVKDDLVIQFICYFEDVTQNTSL
jgi:hypothetical protein